MKKINVQFGKTTLFYVMRSTLLIHVGVRVRVRVRVRVMVRVRVRVRVRLPC